MRIGKTLTTVLILRMMSRRFRDADVREHDVPYGPSAPPPEPIAAPEEATRV